MTVRQKTWARIALWLLVILWMGVIFAFSSETAETSRQTSGRVVGWMIEHFDREFSSLSPEAQQARRESWSFAVRKAAHFVLFTVMGFLACAAFSADLPPRRAFPAAFALGTARAVLDEVQQSFVPGRSAEFRDVCIDAAGVILGAAVLLLILQFVKRRNNKKA